jgi:hypothetical protein
LAHSLDLAQPAGQRPNRRSHRMRPTDGQNRFHACRCRGRHRRGQLHKAAHVGRQSRSLPGRHVRSASETGPNNNREHQRPQACAEGVAKTQRSSGEGATPPRTRRPTAKPIVIKNSTLGNAEHEQETVVSQPQTANRNLAQLRLQQSFFLVTTNLCHWRVQKEEVVRRKGFFLWARYRPPPAWSWRALLPTLH